MGERGRGGVWIPIGMKDIFFSCNSNSVKLQSPHSFSLEV